ncbi:GTP-binding protein, partial [Variovorax sp. 2RAF20]
PVQEAIGKQVAEMVPDGATLQIGYGGIPDAVVMQLTHKRDLGIHTEMVGDGILTLVDAVHIESHLDDPQLSGFDNQAVDQIVAADRIILNKSDLVSAERLDALAARLHHLNEGAQIL